MTISYQNNHYFKHFNLKMFSSPSPTSKISKSRLNYSLEKRKQLLEVYYRLNSNASAVATETGVSDEDAIPSNQQANQTPIQQTRDERLNAIIDLVITQSVHMMYGDESVNVNEAAKTNEDENNEESTECLLQDFHYLCL